jgi:hypothetical protein
MEDGGPQDPTLKRFWRGRMGLSTEEQHQFYECGCLPYSADTDLDESEGPDIPITFTPAFLEDMARRMDENGAAPRWDSQGEEGVVFVSEGERFGEATSGTEGEEGVAGREEGGDEGYDSDTSESSSSSSSSSDADSDSSWEENVVESSGEESNTEGQPQKKGTGGKNF